MQRLRASSWCPAASITWRALGRKLMRGFASTAIVARDVGNDVAQMVEAVSVPAAVGGHCCLPAATTGT